MGIVIIIVVVGAIASVMAAYWTRRAIWDLQARVDDLEQARLPIAPGAPE